MEEKKAQNGYEVIRIEEKKFENLDSVLSVIGQLGTYQKRLTLLVFLVCFSVAFNNLGYVFWGMRLDHSCSDGIEWSRVKNLTLEDRETLLNRSIPWEWNEDGVSVRSKCHYYKYDEDNGVYLNGIESNLTELENCNRWNYDTSVVKSSIVQEMNLVCSRKWLVSATQAAYMIGRMVGAGVYGYLSDRYGRRPILMLAITLDFISSISLCWVTNVYLFLAIRFFLGIQTTGEFQVAFVIASENVGAHYRPHTGTAGQLIWSVGVVVLAGIAYIVRDRFWLQVSLSFPLCLLLLLYFFVPESPRFLLSANQKDKCINHLKNMAKVNKIEFPKEAEYQLQADKKVEHFSLMNLFQYPNIRRTTLLLMTAWFSGSFVYYGLSLNATVIFGDPYLNFLLSGLIEIPAYALAIPLLSRFGRICPVAICYLIAGVSLLIGIFLPNNLWILITILSTFGKGAMTCGYGMIYIITAELYPTRMRSIGFGTCIISARLAASLAPFTSDLIPIWKYFPFVLFSIVAFISSFLIQFLPDATNKPLPQTVEEGEIFNGTAKRCPCERVHRTKSDIVSNLNVINNDQKSLESKHMF